MSCFCKNNNTIKLQIQPFGTFAVQR